MLAGNLVTIKDNGKVLPITLSLDSRGNALQELKRHDEAVASYDRALSIRSAIADASSGPGSRRRGTRGWRLRRDPTS